MSSKQITRVDKRPRFARVAVAGTPLAPLDYRLPDSLCAQVQPGMRVQVPFARTKRIGIVVSLESESSIAVSRLKSILSCPDDMPIVDGELWQTLQWAARYYHAALAEMLFTALPGVLRTLRDWPERGLPGVALSSAGREALIDGKLAAAPMQYILARALKDGAVPVASLRDLQPNASSTLSRMRAKGLLVDLKLDREITEAPPIKGPRLNAEQALAVDTIAAQLGQFGRFLLEGVTGSGKTEVYLQLLEQAVARGSQSLVLVPEIGLTPQLLTRFRERLGNAVGVLHSGMTDLERLQTWLAARDGRLKVVVGTRSAVFTVLPNPGLIIIDEEHDSSYKQQDGVRYSARDLAIVRAQALAIPIVLGSATPSLETLSRVANGSITQLRLSQRATGVEAPMIRVLDLRGQRVRDGLGDDLIQNMRRHLEAGNQVLVFRNRRGYAPSLTCHDCGWSAQCLRCDAAMTVHRSEALLRCHHCGAQRPLPANCEDCGSTELIAQGVGTERLQEALQRVFPGVPLVRIDRSTTGRRDGLQQQLQKLPASGAGILIGTQMLAKGHHLPRLSAVAIVNVDNGLFSADFRAPERLAQLIVQVSGRAGRELGRGEVWLQTYHPDHPLLITLLSSGYRRWAEGELKARHAAGFPPATHMALLRGECADLKLLEAFMRAARTLAEPQQPDPSWPLLLGPMPAPLARRAGRWRAQLLLQSDLRPPLHELLSRWLPQLQGVPGARKVRWSLDVDPQDLG